MAEIKISQANQDEIVRWKNLEKYPMWRRVVEELKKKIDEADKIINSLGADRKCEFTHRDIAIIKKNAYLDLIELPSSIVTNLQGTGEKPTEQMDPYQDQEGSEPDMPEDVAAFLGIGPSDFQDDL